MLVYLGRQIVLHQRNKGWGRLYKLGPMVLQIPAVEWVLSGPSYLVGPFRPSIVGLFAALSPPGIYMCKLAAEASTTIGFTVS